MSTRYLLLHLRWDPDRLAVEYYFGNLQYWNPSRIAAHAVEPGHDGPALRHLVEMLHPVESDMQTEEIDRTFREMSVDAPVSKENACLFLAIESGPKVLNVESIVFEESYV